MKFVISSRARDDLRSIWLFGAEHWSRARANLYQSVLKDSIHFCASFPGTGELRSMTSGEFRALLSGSHVIYFRVENGRVEIVRILHQSQDGKRHL